MIIGYDDDYQRMYEGKNTGFMQDLRQLVKL